MKRPINTDVRPREHLTPAEVEELAAAAKKRGRYGHRDATAIRLAARHGLRVSELCALTWDQVQGGFLHVTRLKGGMPSTHPLKGDEMRALKQVRREQKDTRERFVFVNERGVPLSPAGFARMMSRAALLTSIRFPVHPHMLRHAAGYKLANENRDTRSIQHWLGHQNITHTVRYTALNANAFKGW